MANERIGVKDKRDGFPIFIHSELDDYGLSNAEFRVYGRLARRAGDNGVARESVPKMAADFMVSDRTVRRCLQVLKNCRLINERVRPGKPTQYTLNPRKVWADKKELPAIRDAVFGTTPDMTTPSSHVTPDITDGGVWTPQTGAPLTPQTDEGYPSEGNPKKDIQSGTHAKDPLLKHPAVVAYRDTCHLTANAIQRQDIANAVVDLDKWNQVLRKFMSEGQNPKRIDFLLERYGKASVKISKPITGAQLDAMLRP